MELLAQTCKTEQMNAQRLAARIFLLAGGIFWVIAALSAQYAYRGAPFTEALRYALVYAAAVFVVFLIALFYENLAALILVLGFLGVVILGFVAGWGTGLWAIVFFFFLVPMLLSAILFLSAARMQKICTLAAY